MQDTLLPGFQMEEISLNDDYEGACKATLISKDAGSSNKAVLYVHGWNDYFFQSHLADFWINQGYCFYAIDLRKYGRSLMPHQTPNFCKRMTEYYEELDAAVDIIRNRDGHSTLVINGHSTGGLLTAVWCHDRRGQGLYQAVVHNSPFYDINENFFSETFGLPFIVSMGALFPFNDAPTPNDVYGRSVHKDHEGEWDFDKSLKPIENFQVKCGWVRAIVKAQDRLQGWDRLQIDKPVLVLYSNDSARLSSYTPKAQYVDTVLDVSDINRLAERVGNDVTEKVINRGMHDLCLSESQARNAYFTEVANWLSGKGI